MFRGLVGYRYREELLLPYACGSSLLRHRGPHWRHMCAIPGEPPALKPYWNADYIVCTQRASPCGDMETEAGAVHETVSTTCTLKHVFSTVYRLVLDKVWAAAETFPAQSAPVSFIFSFQNIIYSCSDRNGSEEQNYFGYRGTWTGRSERARRGFGEAQTADWFNYSSWSSNLNMLTHITTWTESKLYNKDQGFHCAQYYKRGRNHCVWCFLRHWYYFLLSNNE